MSLLPTLTERPDAAIKKMMETTVSQAKQEFSPLHYEASYPRSGFGTAILRPRMVGLAKDYWQNTIATTWSDWINATVNQDAYLVITGIFNLTLDPQTTEIFPHASGFDMPIINTQQMQAQETSIVWFSEPFAVSPRNNIQIEVVGKAAATEILGLDGYAVAKRSYLINKTVS